VEWAAEFLGVEKITVTFFSITAIAIPPFGDYSDRTTTTAR
jgi:hypothetical protein